MAGRPLQMDAQVHPQGRGMAVRRGAEADPQTHPHGLHRKLAGRAARSQGRAYDQINIDVFNDLQHTITGWPGGKPNADDSTRPVPSEPFPKRVVVFSPHPDDDVISMGGTFIRLVRAGTRRTRGLRNFGQRGRTRRRRAAEHRHGPRTGLRRPLRRGREDHRRQEEGRTRTASRCSTSRVPSAAPRHAPPSARSA